MCVKFEHNSTDLKPLFLFTFMVNEFYKDKENLSLL